MVREESTDCPLRETLGFIVSCGAIGSSDRKVGSAASVCVCVYVHTGMPPLHRNAMNDAH